MSRKCFPHAKELALHSQELTRKGSPDAICFHFGSIWELLLSYFEKVFDVFFYHVHYEISVY